MPLLKKGTTRLLRTVAGKQHATDADHVAERESKRGQPREKHGGPMATSDDLLEDYMRSPESSEDEVEVIRPPTRASDLHTLSTFPATKTKTTTATITSASTRPGKVHGKKEQVSKRKADDSDDDRPIFSSLQNTARSSASQGKRMTYGTQSSQKKSSQVDHSKRKRKSFKTTKPMTDKPPAAKQAVFKVFDDASMFRFGGGSGDHGEGSADTFSRSRSASVANSTPPSSPEILDLSRDGSLKVRCEACNQEVDLLLKQEYEDEFAQGITFNIARQNAFCRYHMRHDARQEWEDKGYPEIDWLGLDVRLRKQHARLRAVIERTADSSFRQQLEQRMATRLDRQNGLAGDLQASDTFAGYYGPRGQKVMINHIITHFATALRNASRTDQLILAAGRSAGVSGYVQRVLVPELALALIMEDQDVDRSSALSILTKSQRIGEILHEEDGDVVSIDEEA